MKYKAVVKYTEEYICSICGKVIPCGSSHLKESVKVLPTRICEPCAKKYGIWRTQVEVEYVDSDIFPSWIYPQKKEDKNVNTR